MLPVLAGVLSGLWFQSEWDLTSRTVFFAVNEPSVSDRCKSVLVMGCGFLVNVVVSRRQAED